MFVLILRQLTSSATESKIVVKECCFSASRNYGQSTLKKQQEKKSFFGLSPYGYLHSVISEKEEENSNTTFHL